MNKIQIENYISIAEALRETGISQPKIREMIKKKYGKNIKTTCVNCGNKIKHSISRYYSRGNVCRNCSVVCTRLVEARIIYKRMQSDSKKMKNDYDKLKGILKKYKIEPEELFLSIKFYNSSIALLDRLTKLK